MAFNAPKRTDATLTFSPAVSSSRPVAERWAGYVWKACESPKDLRTLADWAQFIGLSYSSLCELCRLVDVRPRDARDLARVLRATLLSAIEGCAPEVLLHVGDRRTLRNLLHTAGLDGDPGTPVTVDEMLWRQTFVPADNVGLIALRAIIHRSNPGVADAPAP